MKYSENRYSHTVYVAKSRQCVWKERMAEAVKKVEVRNFDYNAKSQVVTNENKDMVMNWIKGSRFATFGGRNPIIKIQGKDGKAMVARIGDTITLEDSGFYRIDRPAHEDSKTKAR